MAIETQAAGLERATSSGHQAARALDQRLGWVGDGAIRYPYEL